MMTDALSIAREIREGTRSAVSVAQEALSAFHAGDGTINSATHLFETAAIAAARAIDAKRARGEALPPLAGVPFGVKDLFDVAGHVTTAGSIVLKNDPPAARDAEVVRRLREAGAVLIATLNMDEFAYGFATDNAHYGITRNPRDTRRMAGGSSGGSAAAVAAGFLPFALGTDTNGSIRVPSALCGVWGLKPTYGGLPREGVYPFSASLDVPGPMAGTLDGLAASFYAMAARPPEKEPDAAGLRVARLDGWFAENMTAEVAEAVSGACSALGVSRAVELPEAASARAASFLITAAEGGNLHLPRLRKEADRYDPATRDRLLAGALLPADTYVQAQRFRRWFREKVHAVFAEADVLIAPAVPCSAPLLDDPIVEIGGKPVSARANLGCFTQVLSLPGLPVLALPVLREGALPVGLQLVAAPGKEAALFAVARALERAGVTKPRVREQVFR